MKKRFLTAIIALMVISTAALAAQDMAAWTWDAYDLSFEIPRDFIVSQNTETIFTASSSDNEFSVELAPWEDGLLEADDVAYAALYNDESSWTDITIEVEDWIDNGYEESYLLAGTAEKDEWVLNYVIIGLIDPDSDDNLFVRLSWWDGDYNEYYADMALTIAASIE